MIKLLLILLILSPIATAYSEPPIIPYSNPFYYLSDNPKASKIYSISFDTTCNDKPLLIESSEEIINISYPCKVSNINILFIVPKNKGIYYQETILPQTIIGITSSNQYIISTYPLLLGMFKIDNKFDLFEYFRDTSKLKKYTFEKDNETYDILQNIVKSSNSTTIEKIDNELYVKLRTYIIEIIEKWTT